VANAVVAAIVMAIMATMATTITTTCPTTTISNPMDAKHAREDIITAMAMDAAAAERNE
jgi:hypothetical protein